MGTAVERTGAAAGDCLNVGVLMLPGQVPLDLAGPLEVLATAAKFGAPIQIRYLGPRNSLAWLGPLTLSGIEPLPAEALPLDLLVIPGQDRASCDAESRRACLAWLRDQANASAALMAICSGALLLGEAGLLDGRRCTTHHALLDELRHVAPKARVRGDCIFVEDGRCLTSAGISTGIDTMLHWVTRTQGHRLAQQVARELVLYWRRSGQEPQLGIWLEGRNHVDDRIHRLQDALAAAPGEFWSMSRMAEQAAMSERHLRRRFRALTGISILDYLTRQRLQLARQMMCDTDWGLDRIAQASGFGDARQLRRVWQRFETESPAAWRRRSDTSQPAGIERSARIP
ncbi:GlxA family transcriptional regulator [Salinicola rhizosphaerae]|uniref:AraC family transcriptional regulator n=1 Tax=Salinicola rhizosphaerae TaxID=1443141 RepID=A0ABQ3DXI7_9GAMM|nr:helix-turn-helix domain-containing protein [Salinicola rhizosphaerae]GHB18803.1 AraC family transcriptional regulator [Salinicola rhizosphaerae]